MGAMLFRSLLVVAAISAAICISLARGEDAAAAWCWPTCSTFGMLGPGTSNYNGCWYAGGEVCSGWGYWTSNGINKTCYPGCTNGMYSQARVLYGFENRNVIRGYIIDNIGPQYIFPPDVGMGGYLRAQANWWYYTDGRYSYSAEVHVGAL